MSTVDKIIQALRELYDEQNDAPLERRRVQWQAAMDNARAALAAYDAQRERHAREWRERESGELPAAQQEPVACSWLQDGDDSDTWQTRCGHYFRLDEGDPNDNSMYHCCFCGKPIECNPYIPEEETP